jgi:AcrR family transcriptional regulator
VARRERNIDAVLDVVLEMFGEDMVFPTIEQASKRSGLSLRSLYRYFADPGELVEAAIKGTGGGAHARVAHRPRSVAGAPRGLRVDAHPPPRGAGPIYRATIHNAAAHSRVRAELQRNRSFLREQFELPFAPELAALSPRARVAALEAGNLLTQLDSIDVLCRSRNLTVAETATVLRDGLIALLTRPT